MGFLDRLLGRPDRDRPDAAANQWGSNRSSSRATGTASSRTSSPRGCRLVVRRSGAPPQGGGSGAQTDDERAVERYRYLLRTAPPERIEEVHAEAFATLTPEQRRMVYDEFTRSAPPARHRVATTPGPSRRRRHGPRSGSRASWNARSAG